MIDETINGRLYRTFRHGNNVSTEAFDTKGPVNPVPVAWETDELTDDPLEAQVQAWHEHNVYRMEARRVEA